MRPSNSLVLNAPANASVNSTPVYATDIVQTSAQAVASGTAAGTLQMQASDDYLPGSPTTSSASQPTHWNNIGAPVTVAGAGSYLIPVIETSYEWLRVSYTDTTGGTATGTLLIRQKSNAFG